MEQKIKELEQRRLRIGKAISACSEKMKKLDYFVQTLAGATLVNPFVIPYKAQQQVADLYNTDELVVRKNGDTKSSNKEIYVYIRTRDIHGSLIEKRLRETNVEIRLRVVPHLEEYAEYLVSELENKFNIDPSISLDTTEQSVECKMCHEGDINDHNCQDATGCRYGQQSGHDDYIEDCECYFGDDE